MAKTLYICNRKKCVNCSYPDCYCTTDKDFMEERPSKELIRRFELDCFKFKIKKRRKYESK